MSTRGHEGLQYSSQGLVRALLVLSLLGGVEAGSSQDARFSAVGTAHPVAPAAIDGSARGTSGRDGELLTDLRIVHHVLCNALQVQIEMLPLPPQSLVYLQPGAGAERNWLVEDALTTTLMAQGFGILLRAPLSEEMNVGILSYRIVDARVVYWPPKKNWVLFGGERRREAFGELFLCLEDGDGRVLWVRRVKAFGHDRVPADQLELLSGGDLVKRKVLESDNRFLERGLSASILGGLFYIFFVL